MAPTRDRTRVRWTSGWAGTFFATLASVKDGYGNLMLTPEIQAEFVAEAPDLLVPAGGWGRMGVTHIGDGSVRPYVLQNAYLRRARHLAGSSRLYHEPPRVLA